MLEFTNFCGEGFHWFQVEVVVQVQVVEVLSVNQEVQHVVTLSADLEPHLNPVQLCGLEEFGGLEGTEKVPVDRRTHKKKSPLENICKDIVFFPPKCMSYGGTTQLQNNSPLFLCFRGSVFQSI